MSATPLSSYAFFDTMDTDPREYVADVLADTWRAYLKDGIIQNYGDKFGAAAVQNEMNIKIASGRCLIRGYWGKSDTDIILPVPNSDPVYSRIDSVVLRLDLTLEARNIGLDIKTGIPAADPEPPTPQRDANTWELVICRITVNNNVLSITDNDITDTRDDPFLCGVFDLDTPKLTEVETTANEAYEMAEGAARFLMNIPGDAEPGDMASIGRDGLASKANINGYVTLKEPSHNLLLDTAGTELRLLPLTVEIAPNRYFNLFANSTALMANISSYDEHGNASYSATSTILTSSTLNHANVCKCANNKVVVMHGTEKFFYARCVEIDPQTNEMSVGAAVLLFESTWTSTAPTVSAISYISDNRVLAVIGFTSPSDRYVILMSISDMTITLTAKTLFTTARLIRSDAQLVKLTESKFLLLGYNDNNTPYSFSIYHVDISWPYVTVTQLENLYTYGFTTRYGNIAFIDNDKALIIGSTSITDRITITAMVAQLTDGGAFTLHPAKQLFDYAKTFSAFKNCVYLGEGRYKIHGTTQSLTVELDATGSTIAEMYITNGEKQFAAAPWLVTKESFIIANFMGNNLHTQCVIPQYNDRILGLTLEKTGGILKIQSKFPTVVSGLQIGRKYYLQPNGKIGVARTNRLIGVAISATELMLI